MNIKRNTSINKRSLLIGLIILLTVTILSSCAPKQEEDLGPLTWYINFPWYGGNWGQDVVTQHITELTGIEVEFIIPAGNPNEKLNTLIASDSLPDLITIGWWEDIAKSLQDPRFTYNLEELAEEYDTEFLEVTDQGKRDWYRKEDGGVYGYPNASYAPSDYEDPSNIFSNDTFLVRKDMYEAIGSPDMSTPEGFLAALQKAKEQFGSIDGAPLIPLGFTAGTGSTLGKYLQNFLAIPDVQDNKVYDRDTDPEYIRWLKTLRQANEMGLISRDVFADTRQQIEEKITQGRYFSLLYPYIDAIQPLTNRYNADPNSTYVAVSGPKNSNGDQHELAGPGISGWTLTMISKNTEQPKKAIELLTFLLSPKGMEVAFLGKQGVTWDYIDGEPKFLPEIDELRSSDRPTFDKEYGADWMLWMGMDTAYQSQKWPIPAPISYDMHRQWTVGKVKPRFELENIDPPGNSEEGISNTKINEKLFETIPQLILAPSDAEFDAILDEFIEFRNENGFSALQAYRTKRYLENKQKLGL